jgi:hypothetical protein
LEVPLSQCKVLEIRADLQNAFGFIPGPVIRFLRRLWLALNFGGAIFSHHGFRG